MQITLLDDLANRVLADAARSGQQPDAVVARLLGEALPWEADEARKRVELLDYLRRQREEAVPLTEEEAAEEEEMFHRIQASVDARREALARLFEPFAEAPRA